MDAAQLDSPIDLLVPTDRFDAVASTRVDARTHDDAEAPNGAEADTAASAPAWLLEFDHQRHAALSSHATLEIIAQPQIISVPGAPYYALGMLKWQGRKLAVLDLGTLLNAYPRASSARLTYVVVVAYQAVPRGPIEYAAIAAVGLTQSVQVTDAMQCPLPNDSDLWPLIALSCFSHQGAAVPIIDTGRLFTAHWD